MSTFDPTRPFTVAQGLAAGLTRSVLRGPRYQRIMYGVLIRSDRPIDLELRARAAILVHPDGARVSHSTAARLLRIPVPDDPQIHVTVPARSQRRSRVGVTAHVGATAQQALLGDLPLSYGVELLIELASMLSLVDTVVAGDAMVRKGMLSLSELADRLARNRQDGTRGAREAAKLIRAGVESAMESRVRLLLVLAGFPEPLINHELRHRDGHYRPDLCWPDLHLSIEYDGRHHRSDLNQWDHDIIRGEWFQARGWRVVTLVARDVFQRPGRALHRIHTAWLECGGQPIRLGEEWRRHFPEHSVR